MDESALSLPTERSDLMKLLKPREGVGRGWTALVQACVTISCKNRLEDRVGSETITAERQ